MVFTVLTDGTKRVCLEPVECVSCDALSPHMVSMGHWTPGFKLQHVSVRIVLPQNAHLKSAENTVH